MATKFGRTWWGEQWLNALNSIDPAKRLERGRGYANQGLVKSINIYGNIIQARVQGKRIRPYSVNIIIPPFLEEGKPLFIDEVKDNMLLLSRLLNRELPQELLEIAEKTNLKIFPQSWKDMQINCNCPDWTVPCKHIAAVVYMVANEIDQDPFLVFKLHNFDIIRELSYRKVELGFLINEKIFSLTDCLAHELKAEDSTDIPVPTVPNFSTIDNLLPVIPGLFLANTLFFSGNFKPCFQSIYKKAAKTALAFLLEKKEYEVNPYEGLRYLNFTLTFSANHTLAIDVDGDQEKLSLPQEQLLLLLAQTESKHLDNYSPSFIALYRVFRFCNILVERGAILPRLFHCESSEYKILWVPALLNVSVKAVYNQLIQWLPDNTIQLVPPNARLMARRRSRRVVYQRTIAADKGEGLQLLCAFFINLSIEKTFRQNNFSIVKNRADRKILELFFGNTVTAFNSFNETQIPNTIQLWLKRFYITEKSFVPILQVAEAGKEGFEVEVMVQYKDSELKQTEPLSLFLESHAAEHKMQLLKDLNLLGEYYPDLNTIIETQGKKKLNYTTQSFSEILLKLLPALQLFGIKALLPKSLHHLIRPMVSLSLSSKQKHRSYFSLDELMDYDWQVSMGDTFISPEEFDRLSRSTMGLVKIRDQYVLMDEAEVKKVIQQLQKPARLTGIDLLQAALSGDYEQAPVKIDESLKAQINELLKEEQVSLPASLQATLRPYQHRGFNWMYKNSKLGIGSLLADDMGLGKTLQVITTLLKFKEEGLLHKKPALVIVPTTLLTNWVNEIKKFAPELRCLLFHGGGRKFELDDVDVVITTYGIARTDNEKLCKQHWHVMVVDEAQNIKNPEIAQTKSVKKIRSNIKIAMSGTPVENRLSEYWSIFDFANPHYLGNINWFGAQYARPIEINQDKNKLDKFKAITSPFIMRRVKTDKNVISDLPDKVENNQFCTLTKEQAALYKNLTQDLMLQIEQTEGINRRGLVLKLLTVLKQICNHPANYLKNAEPNPELSGKTLLLLQLLETIYENNEKVLIFSQYQEMGAILRQIIFNYFGKKALQLHGGCTRKERDDMVYAFQNNRQADTFILSIKAGGTGLNLTAAANVIHYDLWWNPAVEAQATDRAFRIGQQHNVMVHRMITKGTLEEKIDEMLRSKKDLANLTVSSGETWVGELSDKELKELISFGDE